MARPALKKRKDGRYRCKYDGKYFYGATSAEAYAARDDYIRWQGADKVREITVADYVTKWLPVHKASVKQRTYNDYAQKLNVLIDHIGHVGIDNVTPSDIKDVYNAFIGYSESTTKKVKMLYTSVWDSAVEDGYAHRNPCRSSVAKIHKAESGSHRPLTPEEDQLILTVQHRMRLFVMAMRYAGLRRGEALALDVDKHVDFKAGVIHVAEAVRYDSNQPILSKPKTDAGIRDVPLLQILRAELLDCHGLISPKDGGGEMSETSFRRAWESYVTAVEKEMNGISKRWYGRTREQKKMKEDGTLPPWKEFTVRPYDLRHSYCTMLRDSGVEMKLAMRWMGHEDEKMILRIYDHITEQRVDKAVDNVEKDILRGQLGGQNGKIDPEPLETKGSESTAS